MFSEHCIKVDSIRITYSRWLTSIHLAFIVALIIKYIDGISLGPLIYTFGTMNNLCTLCVLIYQTSSLLSFHFFPRYSGILYIYLSPLAHGAIYLMFFYHKDEACGNRAYESTYNSKSTNNIPPPAYLNILPFTHDAGLTNAISPNMPTATTQTTISTNAAHTPHTTPIPSPDFDDIVFHPFRLAVHAFIEKVFGPYLIGIGTLLLAYCRRTVLGLLVFQQKLQTRFLNRWLYRIICCSTALGIIVVWLWYPYFTACWDLRKYSPTRQLVKNHISLSEWFGERCVSSWPKLILISVLSGIMHLMWSSFFSYAYYYVDWEEYLRKGTAVWTVGGKVYYSKLY